MMRPAVGSSSHPDIVWLLVDSIRTYPTDGDVRGKLPAMEAFGEESVEFTTCITTAPSTIMSVTAMMTGLPAYFLARNYDQFRFDNRRFPSLASLLEKYGYSSVAFLRGRETRLKLGPLIDPLPRRYWPPGLNHGLKWSNADLNQALDGWLDTETRRPVMLFFHFNPQTRNERQELIVDGDVSDRVATALDMLRSAGFSRDNTITIMCSDHGFPDPAKGLTSEWEARHRLTHDLVLTDDNIKIPLYIQYPDCRSRRIYTPVSSLDLFPTLLALAGAGNEIETAGRQGLNLVPLMENPPGADAVFRDRLFRCDARLMFQTGRATAVRGERYKYIRFHDDCRLPDVGAAPTDGEVLIDLRDDPDEQTNLLVSDAPPLEALQALKRYRAALEETERQAIGYQLDFLLSKQGHLLSSTRLKGAQRLLLLFEPETVALREIGVGAVARILGGVTTDVVTASAFDGGSLVGMQKVTQIESAAESCDEEKQPSSLAYDLSLVFVQDPASPVAKALVRESHRRKARRIEVIDCNFNAYRRQDYWGYRLRSLAQLLPLVKEEPTLIWSGLRTARRVLIRHAARRLGLWDRWAAAASSKRQADVEEVPEADVANAASSGTRSSMNEVEG